jgi:hypothetical protein
LQFDEIKAQHHLGDRMLDLQARVDFHEIEIADGADDELDGAGVDVVERARGRHRGFAHARAQLGREEGRRRFLEHLLVTALRRAFAFVEMDRLAVRIAEDLESRCGAGIRCSVPAARGHGRRRSFASRWQARAGSR